MKKSPCAERNDLMKKLLVVSCWLSVVWLFADNQQLNIQSPLSNLSDTVFVTASRVESRIFNLPISSILITKKDLAIKSIGDVASSIANEAGVDIRNYSIINGASTISLLGSTSQQVLVLLDNIQINSPSSGTPDLGLIPVYNLDRIEIVKGPTSSLYGANALGGVVNFISESPFNNTETLKFQAFADYGSNNTYNCKFQTKSEFFKYSFIFDVSQNNTDGLRTNDNQLSNALQLKTGYKFNDKNKIRLDLKYSEKEIGLPGPQPESSQHPLYGDNSSFTKYDRQWDNLYQVKFNYELRLNPKMDLIFNSLYSNSKTRFLWVNQYAADTALFNDYYHTKSVTSNLVSRYNFSAEKNIVLGIDFIKDLFLAQSEYPSDTQWNPCQNKIGLFTESSLDLLNNLLLFGSLRFDWNSGFGTFFSPSIGISYFLTSSLKIRTQLGRAFRAPTLNDLYWPISGNHNIKPEIGDAFQIGIDYQPSTDFSLHLTGYVRQTRNLINWIPDTQDIWRPTNIDSSYIKGLEWVSKIKITDNINFTLNGTIQDAGQVRQEPVCYDFMNLTTIFKYQQRKQAFLPQFTLSTSIYYQPLTNTIITISGNYTSSRINYYSSYDSFPKIYMKTKKLTPHWTMNCYVSQKVLNYINLTFKINNLFNAQYAEQFGNSIIDKDYPRPDRMIFIGLEIKN